MQIRKLTYMLFGLGMACAAQLSEASDARTRWLVQEWRAAKNAEPRERDLKALALSEALELDRAPQNADAIARKYRQLRAITLHSAEDEGSPVAYHPLETEAVRIVMQEFGELLVDPVQIAAQPAAAWEKVAARSRPWAGYWYPARSVELFQGRESPLARLDALLEAGGQASTAAAWERARDQPAAADTWEGLCGAWAVASILTPEPTVARTVNQVTLSVADQKGLITKLHELHPSRRYGVRYAGDLETDGTYQDLRPEAFHVLAKTLLGRGDAFVIDDEPGTEVWQRPVYQMQWRMTNDPAVRHAVLVQMRLMSISPRQRVTNDLTAFGDQRQTTYAYRLYFDPAVRHAGGHPVIAGAWLGDARRRHPDFAVVPAARGVRRTVNPEINRNLGLVEDALGLPRSITP